MSKTSKLFVSFLFFANYFLGQNKINLIIFSEDSDPFYVFINGVKQNINPETNVKFTDLSPNVSLRIKFEDIALPEIKKTMPMEPNIEHTFRIKKDINKQVKLKYFGGVPLTESATGITTIAYQSSNADEKPINVAPESNDDAYTINQTSSQSTAITTINTQVSPTDNTSENISVNINMGGVGMNMNVNGMSQSSQTSVTSVNSSQVTSQVNKSSSNSEQAVDNGTAVKTKSSGCQVATSTANFTKMKESIESKPFSDTKLSTAKLATKNACLSVNQIKEITKLFAMDEDKLAYAKYAYTYCIDKANYYQVGDVFSFSTSTEELNNFLSEN